jgi:hypothetical protein
MYPSRAVASQEEIFWIIPPNRAMVNGSDPFLIFMPGSGLALLLAQLDLPSEYRYPLWRYQ